MTIGFIGIIRLREGKGEAFEKVIATLQADAHATEPGNLYFELFKQNDTTYVIAEKFADKHALRLHKDREEELGVMGMLSPLLAGMPEIYETTLIG